MATMNSEFFSADQDSLERVRAIPEPQDTEIRQLQKSKHFCQMCGAPVEKTETFCDTFCYQEWELAQ